jgi:hypothetical protein
MKFMMESSAEFVTAIKMGSLAVCPRDAACIDAKSTQPRWQDARQGYQLP